MGRKAQGKTMDKCVNCYTGKNVMDRQVTYGGNGVPLCPDCADIRRALPGQVRASEPPTKLPAKYRG